MIANAVDITVIDWRIEMKRLLMTVWGLLSITGFNVSADVTEEEVNVIWFSTGLSEAYRYGCVSGFATRDKPIEVWHPKEIDLTGTDDTKANSEFIKGYYDCRPK